MNQAIPAEVMSVWKSGRKVLAIQLLREQTGLGLAEAKHLLESANAAELPLDLPLDLPLELPLQTHGDESSPAKLRIHAAIAAGNKLEAVKRLKEATGLGLAEAKERIDDVIQGEPLDLSPAQPSSTQSDANPSVLATAPGEVPRSSSFMVTVVLIVLVLSAVAWTYFKSA